MNEIERKKFHKEVLRHNAVIDSETNRHKVNMAGIMSAEDFGAKFGESPEKYLIAYKRGYFAVICGLGAWVGLFVCTIIAFLVRGDPLTSWAIMWAIMMVGMIMGALVPFGFIALLTTTEWFPELFKRPAARWMRLATYYLARFRSYSLGKLNW